MSTTTGGFLDSFNKWKALPERKDTEAFKKGSTFEKNLRILFKNTTKLYFTIIYVILIVPLIHLKIFIMML